MPVQTLHKTHSDVTQSLDARFYGFHEESEVESKYLEALQIPLGWTNPGSAVEFQFKCSSEQVPYLQTLALKHSHARDIRIKFVEKTHTYFFDDDSTGIISVSGLYHGYFPEFDQNGALEIVFDKLAAFLKSYGTYEQAWPYMEEKYQRYCKMTRSEIEISWAENRDRAAARGTYCHLQAERMCNKDPYDWDCHEMRLINKFFYEHPYFLVIRTEHSVGLPEALLCGQIDVLLMDMRTGLLVVGDFKFAQLKKGTAFCRCPYNRQQRTKDHKPHCEAFGNSPITWHLPANDISKYGCQTNLYSEIYRRRYELSPSRIILIVAQGEMADYEVVDIEFMREVVSRMIEERMNQPEVKEEVARRLKRNPRFLD